MEYDRPNPYDLYAAAALQALIQQEALIDKEACQTTWHAGLDGRAARECLAEVAHSIAAAMMAERTRLKAEMENKR